MKEKKVRGLKEARTGGEAVKQRSAMSGTWRRTKEVPFASTALATAVVVVLLVTGLAGCNEAKLPSEVELRARAEETAAAFLDACGNFDSAAVLSMMSQGFREAGGLGETLSPEELRQATGTFISYRFDPAEDIVIDQDRALVTADIDYGTFGAREENLVLVLEEGAYLVDSFTAMDWSGTSAVKPSENEDDSRVEGARESLRSFVEACIKGDTAYVFKNLSDGYKERKSLEKAWTASEFAGIFGEARSYEFEADAMEMVDDDRAEVDVTVDFGSRGNLESETSRVILVWENNAWRVDVFPFFLY